MYKDTEEVHRIFNDHWDSLKMWGGPADFEGLMDSYYAALENVEDGNVHPYSVLPE